ncbi:MAG TPA: LCCL domain-containing protein [Acidimicrobiales bacterium]|nr:LCCL domain-containing protein [Acidimicrobiales bacterium]
MTTLRHLAAATTAVLLLAGACSSSSDDDAEKGGGWASRTDAAGDEPEGGDGRSANVQDLWLYDRIATIDETGEVVELADELIGRLAGEPTGSVDLGGGVTFHHRDELAARLVGPDGEVRDDVAMEAGLVEADGDLLIGVLGTPEPGAEAPIDDRSRVQLELTAIDDLVAPGDPLLVDVGFLQAYGDGSDEGDLRGTALLAHRLDAGRANLVGTNDEDGAQMVFSTELGSAIAGSVWGDLPAKSHRMMNGFRTSMARCRGGLRCVKRYFDEMVDVAVDFGQAFDCNMGVGRCLEPPDPPRPTPPPPTPDGGAKVHGDPHLRTFDGHHYGMQAVGEFVAARSDQLEVQIRTAPMGASRTISLLTGVAVAVEGHVLSVALGEVHLDGELLAPDALVDPMELGDATLTRRGNGYEIVTGAGHQIGMTSVTSHGFELWITTPEASGAFVGLFGNDDGDRTNDFVTRGGEVLDDPDFEELYRTFVESWRISDDESLFHYGPDESTDTFTDRTLPERAVTLDSLATADRARAAAVCEAAGIVDPTTLDQCTLDYALSGDVAFVRAALTIDTVLGVWEGRLLPDGSDASGPGPDDGHGPDEPGSDAAGDSADVRTVEIPWSRTAAALREGDEALTRVICPPGGTAHRVWGTDVYSDDSSVCTAAVHRGLVTFDDGGEVLIEHRPGLGSYRGSTRNGVTTTGWDHWPGSFVFIGARGLPIEGD